MGDILLEPSVSDMVQALEANLRAHTQLYAGLPCAIIYNEPGVLGLMTDLDVSESCVYRATFLPEQAEPDKPLASLPESESHSPASGRGSHHPAMIIDVSCTGCTLAPVGDQFWKSLHGRLPRLFVYRLVRKTT